MQFSPYTIIMLSLGVLLLELLYELFPVYLQISMSSVTSIIDGLKRLYIQKLKPLEVTYRFNDFVSPLLVSEIALSGDIYVHIQSIPFLFTLYFSFYGICTKFYVVTLQTSF